MPECNIFHVHNYLEKYGWQYKYDGQCWLTGWQGEQQFFPLRILLSNTFISFEVIPLFSLPHDIDEIQDYLRQLILDWNKEILLFKVVEVGYKQLGMIGQLFRDHLTFEIFSHSLGVLAYYCEELSKQLSEAMGQTQIDKIIYQ